ncbi:DNA-binding transcriptional regulator, ArsR family [Pseudobutyrivibrio sp. YE44]|uniref:ArsR/SmtB family transcription factor n=1 Tax=Pseudobutyrivibrio sp. YE44 TaxID=1520802 RepID=UPI000887D2C4|nr:metalloregulator ArsR/SmtB family transcription factor [Pseudobutyrivibrio sp. YE44]SDB24715.1 DNA-binding transcriptional regulator, ArsR family [Pseudobutyrivibrio sp. YE44]
MKIGICTDRIEDSLTYKKSGELFFSPLFEMFAAMHVICNPEHHTARLHWWERIQNQVEADLLNDIKDLSACTGMWLAPMDFVFVEPYIEVRDMDVEEALNTIESLSLQSWKKIFQGNGLTISQSQKKKIIEVSRTFYQQYFYQEIIIIQPLMSAALRKILKSWEQEGIAKSISDFHERLKLTEDELIFYKEKEYHYKYEDIKKIYVTGSIFLSPHLIMGYQQKSVMLVKHFYTESVDMLPPEELVKLYKGLADGTRLQILKSLKHKPDSTQQLALKLNISEAAVSKQLKVLAAGGLVKKKRSGNYMLYSVDETALDFLTYRIYEYLM